MAEKEQLRKLRIALAIQCAAREWRQRDIADKIRVPATTLSNWLHGTHPAPPDLVDRVEVALNLRPGSLPRLEPQRQEQGP